MHSMDGPAAHAGIILCLTDLIASESGCVVLHYECMALFVNYDVTRDVYESTDCINYQSPLTGIRAVVVQHKRLYE